MCLLSLPQLSHPGRHLHKSTQTDTDTSCPAAPGTCKCDATYNKMFTDYKERLHSERQDNSDRDLKEITDQVGNIVTTLTYTLTYTFTPYTLHFTLLHLTPIQPDGRTE